jgi:hypothetical protein
MMKIKYERERKKRSHTLHDVTCTWREHRDALVVALKARFWAMDDAAHAIQTCWILFMCFQTFFFLFINKILVLRPMILNNYQITKYKKDKKNSSLIKDKVFTFKRQ